MKKNKISANKR